MPSAPGDDRCRGMRAELAQGGRACDSRRVLIRRDDRQKRGRIRVVRARGVERLGVALEAFSIGPCQVSIAAAAQVADLSRWQSLQALGVPSFTDRSGRGMRKL